MKGLNPGVISKAGYVDFREEIFLITKGGEAEIAPLLVLLVSLSLPVRLDIEHNEMRKALLIKKETEWIQWFCSFLLKGTVY